MKKNKYFLYPFWKENNSELFCGYSLPILGNQALTRLSISSKRSTQENRINLGKALNINPNLFFSPHQIHSDKIINVDGTKIGLGAFSLNTAIPADSCVTVISNVLLITTWADCIPVLIYDRSNNIVASVHSGWKGTQLNIVNKTINYIKKNSKLKNQIFAAIGPGIRSCCYEVGEEFYDYFSNVGLSEFLIKKNKSTFFDLAGAVFKQLIYAGIKEENIDFYRKCTCCSKNPKFFSCRKDGVNFEGQAAFIGIFKEKH